MKKKEDKRIVVIVSTQPNSKCEPVVRRMTMTTDIVSFAATVGGRFLVGLLTGYAMKKVIKFAPVIIGLFIAALAYLETVQ